MWPAEDVTQLEIPSVLMTSRDTNKTQKHRKCTEFGQLTVTRGSGGTLRLQARRTFGPTYSPICGIIGAMNLVASAFSELAP